MQVAFRPYAATDREGVLALFEGNVRPYFLAEERAELVQFLYRIERGELGRYLVGVVDGQMVAAGGFARADERTACLTWGMVERSRHRQGVGRQLLLERIAAIGRDFTEVRAITIQTSQHTAPFFAKHGFVTETITRDGFGAALDTHHMRRNL